jgi:hypothetical protein
LRKRASLGGCRLPGSGLGCVLRSGWRDGFLRPFLAWRTGGIVIELVRGTQAFTGESYRIGFRHLVMCDSSMTVANPISNWSQKKERGRNGGSLLMLRWYCADEPSNFCTLRFESFGYCFSGFGIPLDMGCDRIAHLLRRPVAKEAWPKGDVALRRPY